MNGFWKRLVPAILALTGLAGGAAAEPDRVGYAYAADSEAFLYSEAHFETTRDGELATERVVYRSADGRLLAEKRLDYAPAAFAPRFELSMAVNGYREGLRRTPDGLQTFYRPVDGGRTYTERLTETGDLVADGGFDRVVAARLEDLRAGRTLTFDFLVPGRLSTYPFRVRKVGTARVLGEPALHLRMEPASFLLRWLAEPVEVYYHREHGRLLRYVGPSNLRDPAGNNPVVRVDFPARPPAPGELERRAAQPNPFVAAATREEEPS
jgi:hypothetical protein